MLKGIVHKFYCDMYRQYILITFDADKFTRMTNIDMGPDIAGGCVCQMDNSPLIMWLDMTDDGLLDMTDCAHESFHIADLMLDMVGMEYQHESGNEHVAYLIGWAMGCVLEAQHYTKVNMGLIDREGNPIDEPTTGFTVIELEDDEDILDMLERSANAWDEKCRNDGVEKEITTREDLAKAIELLNPDSSMRVHKRMALRT